MTRHEEIIVNRLVSMIKDHGIECYTEGGVIFAEDTYTKDGETYSEYVHVPSNVAAVREFLNY